MMVSTVTIESRDHHVIMTWFWKAARRGRFSEAYARLFADMPIDPDELLAIGAALDSILRMKDGSTKSSRLGRLGVTVAGWLGICGRASDDPARREFVDGLFDMALCCGGKCERGKVGGYLIGAAEMALGAGVTAEELAREPDGLAQAAFLAVQAHRLPVSITDMQDTLRDMTRYGPVTDWILEEEVERHRTQWRSWLVKQLRSANAVPWLEKVLSDAPAAPEMMLRLLCSREELTLLRERMLAWRERTLH
jgi:hypothetical protein